MAANTAVVEPPEAAPAAVQADGGDAVPGAGVEAGSGAGAGAGAQDDVGAGAHDDDAAPHGVEDALAADASEAQRLLVAMCDEYARVLTSTPPAPTTAAGVGPVTASVAPSIQQLDDLIEHNFARLDDISALVDSAKGDVAHATTHIIPALLQNARQLQEVYATVDQIEAFVDRAWASAQAFAARADALAAANSARNPKTMARVMRSLSFASKKRGAGAGPDIPDWDPEPFLFNATEVFEAMRQARVGGSTAGEGAGAVGAGAGAGAGADDGADAGTGAVEPGADTAAVAAVPTT